jgi:hypothetical protein
MRLVAIGLCVCVTAAARAEGIDRDSLLSEAPAVPDKGTVRVSGLATGTSADEGVNNTQGQARLNGSIMWTPVQYLAGDAGMYWQIGANGPSARVRYQVLSQSRHGIDAAGGVRFKTVGFKPDHGEVEFLALAGRRFGQIEAVVNGVFGMETGGGGGKDVEGKGFVGWRFNEAVRSGIDGRLQAEVGDAETPAVGAPPKVGRDYDFTVGPAVSWLIPGGQVLRNIQLQALVGLAQPKRTNTTAGTGVLSASVDF